jgi:hypothetical protein
MLDLGGKSREKSAVEKGDSIVASSMPARNVIRAIVLQ